MISSAASRNSWVIRRKIQNSVRTNESTAADLSKHVYKIQLLKGGPPTVDVELAAVTALHSGMELKHKSTQMNTDL
jgi:hypothetical protein